MEDFNFKKDFPEANKFEKNMLYKCSKYSMTGFERMFSLIKSIEYVNNNKVEGDFVECGVWKGGNLILFQNMIEKLKIRKKIYAFDTFQGMTEPTKNDVMLLGKRETARNIIDKLKKKKVNRKENIVLAECSVEDVKKNFLKNTKKNQNLICIKGPVEKTLKIKKNLPKKISILRLDTDWYASTRVELDILFPLLQKNGILIIDDYGAWSGSKKAVDSYFSKKNLTMFKIDISGRLIIKN